MIGQDKSVTSREVARNRGRSSRKDPGERSVSLLHAAAVHGGLVAAGWPAREATMIGASTKYLVIGAAMGSFSRGFIDDAPVYDDHYPSLADAHGCVGKPTRSTATASSSPSSPSSTGSRRNCADSGLQRVWAVEDCDLRGTPA